MSESFSVLLASKVSYNHFEFEILTSLLLLNIKLRVLISVRILCSRISHLSQTFLRSGAYEICLHVIDFSLRVNQVLLTLTLNLNLTANHAIYHVHRFFVFIFILVLLEISFTTFYWVFFINLICLNLLDDHVPIHMELILIMCYCLTLKQTIRIVFLLFLRLSLPVKLRIWNWTLSSVFQRRKCLIDCLA